ncbi:MAG: hypothetical protein A3J37_05425 [Alphaproteobacteria bacterium RIFCSPHIGHO2_12_FULL_45_9]|nr:MAG: hypothetical protein A3B66_07955 [Alphaproteobacteria bacterium RIFCSPHIGHO2_02_FULL_46_13]OFW98611.1 MAG: hypothetical protein A3J37_05425 [Alphaproteobacteria bacterium RIFCSPHIGHO2_12_FULL_45_9]
MIGRVKSAAEAMLFTPVTSEAKCTRLPFFNSFLLYRLTNFSSLPTFSMDFISNGESFHYMDGADTAIRHMVESGELVLNAETILPYLNFYYCYVRLPEGEIILLKNAAEAPHIDLYDEERREDLDVVPEGVQIEQDPTTGDFLVLAPALYDSSPMEVLITVSADGQVTTSPKRMLTLENMQ